MLKWMFWPSKRFSIFTPFVMVKNGQVDVHMETRDSANMQSRNELEWLHMLIRIPCLFVEILCYFLSAEIQGQN